MPTWAEHYAQADRTARRAAADTALRARHAQFDLQAQDKTAKFERPHFAVVGEGTLAAQERYRQNYDRIFSRRAGLGAVLSVPASSPVPGAGVAG